MSTLSFVAKVLKITVLNNNAKVVVLPVSTWILVTILSSMDIHIRPTNSPPPPMYYYTSLKKNPSAKKVPKISPNEIEIDANFLDDVDSDEVPVEDIVLDIKNGNMPCVLSFKDIPFVSKL